MEITWYNNDTEFAVSLLFTNGSKMEFSFNKERKAFSICKYRKASFDVPDEVSTLELMEAQVLYQFFASSDMPLLLELAQ